jgi:hypothetical protein
MLSESDGSSGSRLIFEPIVNEGSSDSSKNRAYIGWHVALNSIYCDYYNAAYGSNSYPSHTFGADIDTGMYRYAANQIGFTAGGSLVANMSSNGISNIDGSESAPSYNFTSDSGLDTGMYLRGTNQIAFSAGGNSILAIASTAVFPDHTSGTIDLGTASYRWEEVFAANATINDSDLRLKKNIQPTKLGLDFINDLNPVTYKWKKKPERRIDTTHYGIIAQEVVETLKDHGVDSLEDFAGITYEEAEEGESYYGARYTEFIPILMKAIQELSAEVKELKEKI